MSDKISLSQADLLTAMKAKDGLKGWDVLVAYDEKSINELLKERIKEMPGILDGTNVLEYTDDDGIDVTKWKFTLHYPPPLMQFNSTDYTVQLTFSPVTGEFVKDDSKKGTLPEGLQLQLTTKLCYVKGEVIDGNSDKSKEERKAGTTPEGGIVISFDEAKDEKNYQYHNVALDFTEVQAAFLADPNLKPDAKAEVEKRTKFLNGSAKTRIENLFKTNAGVKFYLVGLTNKQVKNESGDAKVLTPTSFAVTLIGQSGEPGSLCMWIQCNGRKGGIPDDGNNPLKFTPSPDKAQISPIPTDSTASVIISHDCMWDVFMKPSLEASRFSSPNVTSRLGTEGMTFKSVLPGQSIEITGYSVPIGAHKEFSDDVKFNLADYPLEFTVKPDFAGPNITYNFEHSITGYHIRTETTTVSGTSAETTTEDIYVTIKFSASGSGSWKITKTKDAQNQIELPFSSQTGMQVNLTQEKHGGFNLAHYSQNFEDHVRGVSLPTVNVDFGHLDYFLATNLLFPGEKVFYAKEGGIATPRNTIIVGDIMGKQK